jgi:hypothetical protein
MEPEGSLPYSQVPATCPYPEPTLSSVTHPLKFPEDSSLSHLTSCTPTKSNFYLANFLAAAASDPARYRFLTFQVPNRKSLFFLLRHTSSRNTPSPPENRKVEKFTSELLCLQRKHPVLRVLLNSSIFTKRSC